METDVVVKVAFRSSNVTHRIPGRIQEEADDLMKYVCNYAGKLPNGTDAFTSIVSKILSRWRHSVENINYFRYSLISKTGKNVYDEVMLTLKHRKKKDKTGGMAFHKTILLPKPPYKSCSVVGSSGILLGSRCGSDIDDKDFVFRFNLAPIAGYEEDVGTKINITTMNPTILNSFDKLDTTANITKFAKARLVDQDGLVWTPSMRKQELNGTMNAIKVLNDSKLILVRENHEHYKHVDAFWKGCDLRHHVTTGFYFVTVAVDLCSEVHLYGFWPFEKSLNTSTVPIHYYDSGTISTYHHDPSMEIKLLLSMHRSGMIKLHTDNSPCSS